MGLCILLITGCLMTGCGTDQPKQNPPEVPLETPSFDGNRAYGYLKAQTDFGPRVAGTPAHELCVQYFQKELGSFAESVTLQPFRHRGYRGVVLPMTNLLASFNRKASARVLLVAHWDSRPRADQDHDPRKLDQPILGANDGASGVAVLLEIAGHLKARPPAVGVDILLVDGEDYGREGDTNNYLLGSRYFAKNLPPGFKPLFGILLDMVGDKDLEIQKEPNSLQHAPDIVDLVWSSAKELGVYQFSDLTQRPVLDDHIPLNEAGIKTIDLIDFEYPPWHTSEDTPDKCSAESLEAVGKVLLHVLYKQR